MSAKTTLTVLVLGLACGAAVAQPRDRTEGNFGDRQSGKWGNPDEGHFGNAADGHFGWSRQPLERRVVIDPETGRPVQLDSSPYLILDLPPDEDRLRDN